MKPGKNAVKRRKTDPPVDDVNALVALYNNRRYAETESQTRVLLGHYPNFAFGWKMLAGTLQMQGKDALTAFQKVVELMPDDASAYNNLGVALKNRGRLGKAVASYQQAVLLKPDYAEAHSNLGAALRDLGRLDDAVASYREAIACKPDFALAYYNMGNAQQKLGRREDAMTSYRLATEIKPDFVEAHFNLGSALKDLGQFDEAVTSYRKVVELKPDYVEAHKNLGIVLQKCEQLEAAEASFRKALEIDPACIEALLGVSYLYVVNGDTKRAEESIQNILAIQPDNSDARLMLAGLKKTRSDDENLAALLAAKEAALNSNTPMSNQKAIQLSFVLGKCFDDLGEHDRAFSHFIEGCKLKRATFEYDPEQMTQFFNDIMRIFNKETIERLRGGGNLTDLPVFVLGMPRSGTTLTEQIIASHPDVFGAGELSDLNMIAQRHVAGASGGFPHNIPAINQAYLAAWAADYVAGLQKRALDAKHITDKMPANFFFIGLIHLMLPNAKIIHVNRNPVDNCVSCFVQSFSSGHEYTYDLSELGRYYVDYARLMEHWRKVLPAGAFLDVQYEDIVADQESQARRIIDFCGLTWSDSCIDFHKYNRPVITASMTQVRQPIYKSSVERWRNYEKFLGPLLDTLGELVPNRDSRQ
jgi:tetratricopeptide (TPR) repeat protein